jgi:hypothetical protein
MHSFAWINWLILSILSISFLAGKKLVFCSEPINSKSEDKRSFFNELIIIIFGWLTIFF